MTETTFEAWLEAYGRAWQTGDPDAVLNLFSEDAAYFETPFDEPMTGHAAIRRYWTEGASRAQTDVRFSYTILSVEMDRGLAHWQATFRRVPSGVPVELDGVLMALFDGNGRCREFREWWHRQEGKTHG